MSDRFENRIAVVTGGASGIGEGIARRIAAEGGKVVVFDLDQEGLGRVARQYGFLTQLVNVGVEHEVQQAIGWVVQQFGKLDIMVNSAGIVGPTGIKIIDYPSSELENVLQVTVYG